tara:strand:- start:3561 stop:3830 length:270 start_codon:yes stop_codon:yes gene_type:complete
MSSGPLFVRYITNLVFDENHQIVEACSPNESWSPKPAADVIQDIESGLYLYVVELNKKLFELKIKKSSQSKKLELAKRSTRLQGFSWAR